MKLKYYLRGVGVGLILAVAVYSTIIIPRKYRMTDEEVMRRAEELGMVPREDTDVDLSALFGTPAPTGEGTGQEDAAGLTPAADGETLPMVDRNPGADSTMPEMPEGNSGEDPGIPEMPGGNSGEDPSMPGMSEGNAGEDPSMPEMPEGNSGEDPGMPTMPEGNPDTQPTQPDANPTMPVLPDAVPSMPAVPTMPDMPTLPPEPVTTEPAQSADGRVSVTITTGMGSETFALELQKAGVIEDAADFDRYLMQNNYALIIRPGTYRFLPGTTYEEIAGRVTGQ